MMTQIMIAEHRKTELRKLAIAHPTVTPADPTSILARRHPCFCFSSAAGGRAFVLKNSFQHSLRFELNERKFRADFSNHRFYTSPWGRGRNEITGPKNRGSRNEHYNFRDGTRQFARAAAGIE
jgi:hypothetical protein